MTMLSEMIGFASCSSSQRGTIATYAMTHSIYQEMMMTNGGVGTARTIAMGSAKACHQVMATAMAMVRTRHDASGGHFCCLHCY